MNCSPFSFKLISALFFLLITSSLTGQPNDICSGATSVTLIRDTGFVCLDGSLDAAQLDAEMSVCSALTGPGVWYTFTTDEAAILNLHLSSMTISNPMIRIFEGICDTLNAVDVGLPYHDCIVGFDDKAKSLNIELKASTSIYILVSCAACVEGDFTLCMALFNPSPPCVTEKSISVVARSEGTDLGGPFVPGELVSFCMEVTKFSAAGNGCQWFQGLIPVFGAGWADESFDPNWQPKNTTVNGILMGVANNGLYGTATWDWFSDVDYHFTNPSIQHSDFDNNGNTEFCNSHFMYDCPDIGGLVGGCCGPCWNTTLGTILPNGWFAYGINGTCPTPGPPIRVDWGDGNTCGAGMGPWKFCFTLKVKELAQNDTSSFLDLLVGFMTTADGETGSWTGGPSICANDPPEIVYFGGCVEEIEKTNLVIDDICGDTTLHFLLDVSDADYWQYNLVSNNPIFNQSGVSTNGDSLHLNIHASDDLNYHASLHIVALQSSRCPLAIITSDFNVITPGAVSQSIVQDSSCKGTTLQYIPDVPGISNWLYHWELAGTALSGEGSIANGDTFLLQIPNLIPEEQNVILILEGSDAFNCGHTTITVDFPLYSSEPVIADFDYSIVEQTVVSFQNHSVNATSFLWEYGDGVTSIVENPFHVYDTAGNYIVTLIANGACSSDTFLFLVTYVGNPPLANFEISDPPYCVPASVTFYDSSIGASSVNWIFEGGTPSESTSSFPTVDYNAAGIYDVTLIAHNVFGSDTLIRQELVTVEDIPSVDYSVSVEEMMVTFQYTGDGDHSVIWYIDGAEVSEEFHFIYELLPGIHDVLLTATNDCGSNSISFSVEILGTASHFPAGSTSYQLFPNPASSGFYLHASSPFTGDALVTLLTPLGVKVAQLKWADQTKDLYLQKAQIDMAPGLLLVRLETKGTFTIMKVWME